MGDDRNMKKGIKNSIGKVATENMFIRDNRLAVLFVKYMLENITHLKKYEDDPNTYEMIRQQLMLALDGLENVDSLFRQYNKK